MVSKAAMIQIQAVWLNGFQTRNPEENFADKWVEYPQREKNFTDGLTS